ncbi:hypothetical protein C4578_03235 [Candidatus Microgenomates bacterium]|jgi:hypothetical protein|nr:MAG: hypothetical protein C4578_03235 [Candidatus Microgenomates bacterium]
MTSTERRIPDDGVAETLSPIARMKDLKERLGTAVKSPEWEIADDEGRKEIMEGVLGQSLEYYTENGYRDKTEELTRILGQFKEGAIGVEVIVDTAMPQENNGVKKKGFLTLFRRR